jgi:uncharacterized RDD family membrane protein YckC
MSETSGGPPPGWYYAPGDPMGTQRWWDGTQWVGGPVLLPQPPPPQWMPGYLHGIDRRLADPGKRIVARIVDILILAVVLVVPLMIWLVQRDDGFDAGGFDPPGLTFTLVAAIPSLLYEVGFVAIKGATPGKMAMGITVIRQDGTDPPGWGPAVLRRVTDLAGLVPFASVVLTIVSFVFLFTDDRRRTIPDRIASTYVVDVRGR